MKCRVCSFQFPDDKRSCPNCGRIITEAERKQYAEKTNGPERTQTSRPASSRTTTTVDQETAFVRSLFDPNAPEYKDPHTYDNATAAVLEYDRTYVSRTTPPRKAKANSASEDTIAFDPKEITEREVIIIPERDDADADGYSEENTKNSGSVNRSERQNPRST